MNRISGLVSGLLVLLMAGSAGAQATFPEKPIRIIVGFPSGSQVDVLARLLGQKLAEAWGKPVVIDDITGAAGNIATDRVAKAAPDGYTLGMLATSQLVINPSLYKLAFDPAKDFTPISQASVFPNVLVVNNQVPVRSFKELVALARTQPGVLTFASGGSGQSGHMAAELLKHVAGLDIRHIPYKGVVAAIPDLMGGRITMMFSTMSVALPLVREGKLRALAVTSLKRYAAAADLPTVAESGYPGYEVTVWNGLLAPARTPEAIVRKLQIETVRALALPDLRAKFAELGVEGVGNTPEEFAAVIKSEIPKWATVIRESGIKPD